MFSNLPDLTSFAFLLCFLHVWVKPRNARVPYSMDVPVHWKHTWSVCIIRLINYTFLIWFPYYVTRSILIVYLHVPFRFLSLLRWMIGYNMLKYVLRVEGGCTSGDQDGLAAPFLIIVWATGVCVDNEKYHKLLITLQKRHSTSCLL